jgi:hypothetical protein
MSAGADLGQIIFRKVLSADSRRFAQIYFYLRHYLRQSAESANGKMLLLFDCHFGKEQKDRKP